MSLQKNVLRVFSANFLSMISSLVIGFIIPAVLSVDQYSNLKTYTFYLSYITIFHLGFIDGMYIKYGGKDINEISKSDLKLEHNICLLMQTIITSVFIVISILRKDLVIFFMAISIIPINMSSFYKQFYQSVGEFRTYVSILNVYTILNLIFNLLLSMILKIDNYKYYCVSSIISNLVVFIYLEINYYRIFWKIKCSYNPKVWNNIKVGIFILIGNLSVSLFYGLDRWFIKIFYTSSDFAYYSFAVSMLNIVNTLMAAVTVTFYNHIAKYEDIKLIKKLKKYLIIIGAFSSCGYFVFSAIINIALRKYIPSLDIIAISFSAYPYIMVINSIYVNLYKVKKDERKYLKVVISMLLISTIYNLIAVFISKNSESIALATTIGFITWYIYSSKDFKNLKPNKEEVIFLFINLVAFISLSHMRYWLLGGIIYITIFIISTKICFSKEFKEIYQLLIKKLKRRKNYN